MLAPDGARKYFFGQAQYSGPFRRLTDRKHRKRSDTMKRRISLLILLALLLSCAQAEVYLPDLTVPAQATGVLTGSWGDAFLSGTSFAEKDIYRHATEDCYGLEGRAVNPDAAAPCPICVPEKLSGKITASVRGGTVIVRIPESWMEKQSGFEAAFFSSGAREYLFEEAITAATTRNYTGSDAGFRLAGTVHGQAYTDLLSARGEGKTASAATWSVDIASGEKMLVMNRRYLGNAWYFVLRPTAKVKDTLKVNLSLFRGRAEIDGNALRVIRDEEWHNKKFELKPKKDDAKAAFSAEYDGCKLTLYETAMDVYAAVIHKYNASENDLFYLQLKLDNRESIVLDGYMNGNKGVFCGVLTKGEAQMIMEGRDVIIENAPQF